MINSKIEQIRKIKDENNKLKRINDELNMRYNTQRLYASRLEQENHDLKCALKLVKGEKDLQALINKYLLAKEDNV